MARMHQRWWIWASCWHTGALACRSATLLFFTSFLRLAAAQEGQATGAPGTPAQDLLSGPQWNLYYQATSIGQYHGSFPSPYQGPLSLAGHPEAEASITATLFFGLRWKDTQLYFDPELAGGRGFSDTNGIANFPNGEMPRVELATPKPYLARLYITQDFGFGDKREKVESDANQVEGSRPATRYSITVGRFSLTDFFDGNRYTNDPRTQFMGWAIMYNGAWDYAADTRGYTWGWVHEFHTPRWSVRYASVMEPTYANGPHFDTRVLRDRGDQYEGELDYAPGGHPGAIRLMHYENRTRSESYAEAIRIAEAAGTTPSITANQRVGTLKYGFGLSADQEIRKGFGILGRLGWNDGKTESFAFTAMDRLASGGVSFTGMHWKRPEDTVASEITAGGLSAVHAQYLAMGGLDFLIGDGKLRYGEEMVWESYYAAQVWRGVFASFDLQYVINPAYNQARGPVWVESLRLHLEGAVHK
jgi:high affinity Mn2+ porin